MSQEQIGAARVMPNSPNAEKSVLGAMMISPDAVAAAMEVLTAEDFYFEIHKRIYEAMVTLSRSAQPVDFVTLTDQLEKDGNLEALGGYEYITELNRFVPTAAHIDDYIRIVSGKSLLRRLISACAKITEDAFSGQEVFDILHNAERAIFTISQNKQKQSFVSIQEAVNKTLDKVDLLMRDPDALAGLRTGFNALDNWLGGLRNNELILLAARPSMGKSAFALNIAEQVPRNNPNATVAIFSLEMPYEDIAARMLSSIGYIPLQNLRTGRIQQDQEMDRLIRAAGTLSDTSIYIDDTSSITVMEMRSKCRRLKMERGLSLVIIDYLQLISGAGGGKTPESHQQEVAEMTRALKIMARELEVPIILLSQLSRGPDRRDPPKPILSDLRDSGAIEQDADVVIFLYRDAYYANMKKDVDPATITNEAEIIIAKIGNGPTGTVKMMWDSANASYRDLDAPIGASRVQQ